MPTNNKLTKQIYNSILICLIAFSFSSCYYDVIIEEEVDVNTTISFSEEIAPVFKSSCVSCHDGVIAYPNLSSAHAYESLISGNFISTGNATNSSLIQKLNDKHPFEGAVTNAELQKIILWINQGASDN
ncbi:hypothetical protein [Plebeiibacterium sediminum]|uniref:Cytochrome c domain-containing protein n=1 Tax=Plebeiibacterium sediminum TaxID=2992112 RepID=A0AAE3SEN9_9BACT|nr:hypothetical protein [Plebeiobacterium sediminum]MCW3785328.1 hypothetical protein [Plebeiobacterium sediminum]